MVDQLPKPAARARMALVLEALFPLGEAKTDRLQGVLAAIASAPGGMVQLAVSPDVHWQRQACRRITGANQHAGCGHGPNRGGCRHPADTCVSTQDGSRA